MTNPIRLAVLISGGGTTLRNLLQKRDTGCLNAEIVCVISSSSKAKGLDYARDFQIPFHVVTSKNKTTDQFSEEINQKLAIHQVDLVVLGGFLKLYLPGNVFADKCINIHPSLIPAFSGAGFYGMRVHEALYKRGCLVSGCTVHLVTEEYDAGPILSQRALTLSPHDRPEDIQKKVFDLECEALPEVINGIGSGKIQIRRGRVSFH